MTTAELTALLKKNPFTTACAGVALLAAAAIYFRSSDRPDLQSQLERQSAEGGRIAANIRHAAQLPEQLSELQSSLAEIEPRLVKASRLATNLQYFYKLEADTGVKIMDLRQNPPPTIAAKNAPKTLFTAVNFSVSVQGNYASVVNFIRGLENGAHFSRVLTASLSGVTIDSGTTVDARTDMVRATFNLELLGQP